MSSTVIDLCVFVCLFQVNDWTQGHTALSIAIEGGHNEAVKVLVQEYQADVEKPDIQMMRPLHNCAQA